MRKFYHIYVPMRHVGEFVFLITFMVMISGFLATLEYGAVLNNPELETTFNLGLWAEYMEWWGNRFNERHLFVGALMPIVIGLTLTIITYNMPDIKLFRRKRVLTR